MLVAQAPAAALKSEPDGSQTCHAPARQPVAAVASIRRVEWAALGAFWLLALASVAIYSLNFRAIIAAGNRLERDSRAAATQAHAQPNPIESLARQAPPLMLDPDSYCWIGIAQQQAREGRFRVRDVSFDNAPAGRELHWSSSFTWWLLLLGAVTHGLTGLAMPQAIAAAAAWANPILFALFLTGLAWALRRSADVWTTGALMVTLAALQGVSWDFSYARPDHHGLHQMAFLGMFIALLCAGLGWVRDRVGVDGGEASLLARAPLPGAARRGFAVSGAFAGMGLWIGATQQMFLIGAVGAGAALGILLFARPISASTKADGNIRFAPVLWRHWGRAGAIASVGFYLLEYFPDRLSMRLEVNHPLYALALLGGGELLCALGRWRACRGEEGMAGRMARGTLLGVLCLSALPLAVLCGPRDWYSLRETVLLRMMHTVSEGQPLVDPWSMLGFLQKLWQNFGSLPLALPLAAGALLMRRKNMAPWQGAALLAGCGAAAVCLGWTLIQSRWLGLAGAALAVLAVLILPAAWGWRRRFLPLGLLALAAPGWGSYWLVQSMTFGDPPALHARTLLPETLASEELAWAIRVQADLDGLPTPLVMTPLETAPALHYFGGAEAVGSIYWENVAGCRALADFYGDAGDAAARRIARERKLDFVAAITRPSFVQQMRWLKYGDTRPDAASQTLAFRLANPMHPQPPDWLEPISLRDAPLAERGFRLYRVRRDRL